MVDSWINERTPNAARGRVIAIYTITITLALTGSQFMIGLFDVASAQLIMVVSGLFSLALIPVSLTTARTPAQPKVVSVSVRHLYRVAPVAAVGCFAVGFMNTAVMNITPYFLSNAAVPVATIGLLMGMIQTGRLVMQWPVGWLSDKIDRRLVILAAAGAIVAIMLALAFVGPAKGAALRGESGELVRLGIIGLFCLWGAFALTLYAICVAHAQDRGAPGESVGLTSSLLFAWAIGATVGPAGRRAADGAARRAHAVLQHGRGRRGAGGVHRLAADAARAAAGGGARRLRERAVHQPGDRRAAARDRRRAQRAAARGRRRPTERAVSRRPARAGERAAGEAEEEQQRRRDHDRGAGRRVPGERGAEPERHREHAGGGCQQRHLLGAAGELARGGGRHDQQRDDQQDADDLHAERDRERHQQHEERLHRGRPRRLRPAPAPGARSC